MRNYWCPPPPPSPPPEPPKCYGEPIRGEIINGRVYPYGCVTEETYAADKSKTESELKDLNTAVNSVSSGLSAAKNDISDMSLTLSGKADRSELPEIRIQDSEPVQNNCIWFKPYKAENQTVAAMLSLNPDTSHSDYLSEIDGTDYGVDNTVKSENELTEGTYSFEIKK